MTQGLLSTDMNHVALFRMANATRLQEMLLLRVPSAVVGRSFNRLFNPQHAQAASAKVLSLAHYPFDDRLLRRR